MPKNALKDKQDAKRPRLKLSELASYDDICTDALVDNVFFWSTIRKNRQKYNSGRGFSEDVITQILFDHIVCEENVKTAEAELLNLSGFKRFLQRLKTPREQEDLKRHLRKYVNIWLPDCPWEVTTTNRYTIITQEAAVVARRDIRRGETINYLCGTLVEMTFEEEKDLDLTRRDFSIVTSSRNKRTSLFLGPARFANHDCQANARLTTTGSWGMSIVAMRTIYQGEEITVTYGEDYFGIDNCECLCGSCEQAGIGGWTKSQAIPSIEKTATPEDDFGSYSFRRRRRNHRNSYSPTTPDTESFLSMRKRRSSFDRKTPSGSSTPVRLLPKTAIRSSLTRVSSVLARCSPESCLEDAVDNTGDVVGAPHKSVINAPPLLVPSDSQLKQDKDMIQDHDSTVMIKQECLDEESHQTPSATILKRNFTPENGEEPESNPKKLRLDENMHQPDQLTDESAKFTVSFSPRMSSPDHSQDGDSRKSNTIESPSKKSRIVEIRAGNTIPLSPHSEGTEKSCQFARNSATPELVFGTSSTIQVATPVSSHDEAPMDDKRDPGMKEETTNETTTTALDGLQADDSDLSELDSDEEFNDKIFQIVRRKKQRTHSSRSRKQIAIPDILETTKIRYPGDYVMTPILLAEPFSRWVQCMTCKGVWVQANGYYTRRECPRCERHSKLYGYQWPKIYDEKMERVTDHRTVHRFLSQTEEEELRSKTRLLQEMA